MNPGSDQPQGVKETIDVAYWSASDNGQGAAKTAREAGQQRYEVRGYVNEIRRRGDINQRAVKVDKDSTYRWVINQQHCRTQLSELPPNNPPRTLEVERPPEGPERPCARYQRW